MSTPNKKWLNDLNDKEVKDLCSTTHFALHAALSGEFDKYWAGKPKVMWRGKLCTQREMFIEKVMAGAPDLDKELIRRKLHLK